MRNTILLTLGQATKISTASKATIQRAIKSGKLSANKEGGEYRIDPAELERWEGTRVSRKKNETSKKKQSATVNETHSNTVGTVLLNQEILHLQEKLTMLQTANNDLRNERDDWKGQAKVLALTDQSKRKKFLGIF